MILQITCGKYSCTVFVIFFKFHQSKMANVSMDQKCSSDMRKIRRKLTRLLKKIQEHVELQISIEPTNHLMITNEGIETGIKSEDLLQVFSPFGPVKAITLVPGKTFSFITYTDSTYSLPAYQSIHGKKLDNFKSSWLLIFVKNVPEFHVYEKQIVGEHPPGLILIEDFITEEKEEELKQLIKWNSADENVMKHREVQHFGYSFNYDSNNVDVTKPLANKIPQILMDLLTSLLNEKRISFLPDQLTINRYLPGQGIPLHVDTHSAFESEILSLSVGSSVLMNFKHIDGRQINVLLPPRSLLIMTDESRYDWKHGITPRKTDVVLNRLSDCVSTVAHRGVRISFTFRKIRTEPCHCNFKTLCDSQSGSSSAPKSEIQQSNFAMNDSPENFEKSYVYQVYEQIADHFSSTRYKHWPKIAEFINSQPIGTLMLDIGCGNGKYLDLNSSILKIGCDRSTKLMSICAKRNFQGFCSDALNLPVRSDCFDVCLCIAVIHHLSTIERRRQVVTEICRVLRPSGQALIYVWAIDQNADGKASTYLKTRKCQDASNSLPNADDYVLPVHTNRSKFEHSDLFVPWKLASTNSKEDKCNSIDNSKIFYRYYHMFEVGELESLCKTVSNLKLLQSYYDKGNFCVLVEKVL